MTVRILLLQARLADDPMKEHEQRCFEKQSGIPRDRTTIHNLLDGPPSLVEIKNHDALLVGGSGDFYVSRRNLPRFDELLGRLREVVDAGHPTFASCFGYQLLVVALGGEIRHEPDRTEVGTYEMQLTDEGTNDELFSVLPPLFAAQMGHKDRAILHPEGIPNLASSEMNPLQALRVPEKPIWATQFHPELDRDTNLDRYRHYLDGYAHSMSEEERLDALSRFRDSHEVSQLLRRFVKLVFE